MNNSYELVVNKSTISSNISYTYRYIQGKSWIPIYKKYVWLLFRKKSSKYQQVIDFILLKMKIS